MEVAAGAMTSLLCKLGELLLDEYNLEKRVRKGVKSLLTELEMMHAILRKVGEMPPDQLDEQVLIWAAKVRELSYDMEDAVDSFMVHVGDDGRGERGPNNMKNRVKKFIKKTTKLFSKGKAHHQILDAIKEAKEHTKELGDLRQRYMIGPHGNGAREAIDPRLKAVYTEVEDLVGIEDTRDELIKMLTDGDKYPAQKKLRTISIVGSGGLGKTTLAKAVYEKIKGQFDCGAFVSVSQKPDMNKIFKKILYELDENKFVNINETSRDEGQLISELRKFLLNKRYVIIIDDIWDKETWGFIKLALSNNSLGSRIMTTTRIGSVHEASCSSSDDVIYQMKPLTNEDSKRLFNKRIFPQGSECPEELEQVSQKILKKCGGVPLAINTIASLLASHGQQVKPKYQWENIFNSIGRGISEGGSEKDMQRILSFSYYDLPSHLKTCLLYLSIFPEDYEIRRDRLIWRWIAEGFVQRGKQESTLFESGESYFNELTNRNLIQPIHVDEEGRAKSCRVHDMVHDLICSMSSEENFVTVLDGTQQSKLNSHRKIRRLSFQNSMSKLATLQFDSTSMSHLRSVTLFRTDVHLIQTFSSFQVLRVLDLEGCNFGESCHKVDLTYVQNLLHLRYLGLQDTRFGVLPMEIGKLKFLETLDLRGSGSTLPSSVVRLRHLMCLYFDMNMKIPIGMGNLTSLEELIGLCVDGFSSIEKELGLLMGLRVLDLFWEGEDESLCSSLVVSLSNLQNLQSLIINSQGKKRFDVSWDNWEPPPRLRSLVFSLCTSTLPRWINSSSLPLLSFLNIEVDRVRPEVDIQILGKLPALHSLELITSKTQYTRVGRFVLGADAFPCLKKCRFMYFQTGPSMFPRGSMPRLEFIDFFARASHIASGDLDVGMEHLPSLQLVEISLWPEKGSSSNMFEESDAALRLAVDIHPNRPTLRIYRRALPTQYVQEEEVVTGTD